MVESGKSPNGVKPADALGTLSRRSRASRVFGVVSAVAGALVLALLAGLIFRFVIGGADNAPDVPLVEVK